LPDPASRAQRFYHPELDALRFFAFLLVYISHALPAPGVWVLLPRPLSDIFIGLSKGGESGVDLFFALSSWLITALLIREHREFGAIDVKAFYIRRILRIWPLYYTFLLVFRPLVAPLFPSERMPAIFVAAFALLMGNWACAVAGFPLSFAGPLWSVSIEEQFYIVWPMLLRRWLHVLPRIAVGLIAVSFVTRGIMVALHAKEWTIWSSTLSRLDPIAAGALVAFLCKGEALPFTRRVRLALMLGGVAIFIAIGRFGSDEGPLALVCYPMATVASVLIIVGALTPLGGKHSPLLGKLAYLGQISYGLYVFHVAMLQLAGIYGLHPLLQALFGLAGTIAVAALSYHFLESPFLRLKDRFTRVRSRPVSAVFQSSRDLAPAR